MKTKTKEIDNLKHAKSNASGWLESIQEMVTALNDAKDDDRGRDEAERTIHESVLSVEVRTGWYTLGRDSDKKPAEYNILLSTGGPALRLIGELSEHGEPESARLEMQDWGTPWTEYRVIANDEKTLVRFASMFYFGE